MQQDEIKIPLHLDIMVTVKQDDEGNISSFAETSSVVSDTFITTKKTFSCSQCRFTCNSSKQLDKHVSESHKFLDGLLHHCEVCGYVSPTKAGLAVHKSCTHNPNRKKLAKKKSVKKTVSKKKKIDDRVIRNDFSYPSSPEKPLKSEIVYCRYARCRKREKFIKGTGVMFDGHDFCSMSCVLDHKEYINERNYE